MIISVAAILRIEINPVWFDVVHDQFILPPIYYSMPRLATVKTAAPNITGGQDIKKVPRWRDLAVKEHSRTVSLRLRQQ